MIDNQQLELAVQDLRNTLRDGLIASDIWDKKDGLSLAGFNQQPVAVALFTRITAELEASLGDSSFPPLNRYYLLDMANNHTIAVVNHGDMLQGILVDNKKANLGILISVAIPRMLDAIAKARTED